MDWVSNYIPTDRHAIVTEVFSTITSPVFSELVIVLKGNTIAYLPREVTLFDALRRMNEIRPFKLVFLLDVPEGEVLRNLVEELDLVTTNGFLDFLDSPPTIRYEW